MVRVTSLLFLMVALAGWMVVQAHGREDEPPAVEPAASVTEAADATEPTEEADGSESSEPAESDGAEPHDSEKSDDHEHPDADDDHKDAEAPDHGHKTGHTDGDDHGHPSSAEMLKEHDADNDNKLSEEELTAALATLGDAPHGDHQEGHEEEGGVSPLPFDPDLAIFTVIVFVVLLLVLGKFAWGPIIEGLDKRETAVANQIDEARESNEKAAALLVEYEERLAAASAEAKEMVEEARRDSEATRERIVSEATEAATREKERALEAIQLAKESALHDLTQQSVAQAVTLAKGIVRREVKAEDHAQLIQETLEKFPSRN